MNELSWLYAPVIALFGLMAFRAFRSGSGTDLLLAGAQCVALLALITPYKVLGLYSLLVTAVLYLVSQVLTGARRISYLLPVAGFVAVLLTLLN